MKKKRKAVEPSTFDTLASLVDTLTAASPLPQTLCQYPACDPRKLASQWCHECNRHVCEGCLELLHVDLGARTHHQVSTFSNALIEPIQVTHVAPNVEVKKEVKTAEKPAPNDSQPLSKRPRTMTDAQAKDEKTKDEDEEKKNLDEETVESKGDGDSQPTSKRQKTVTDEKTKDDEDDEDEDDEDAEEANTVRDEENEDEKSDRIGWKLEWLDFSLEIEYIEPITLGDLLSLLYKPTRDAITCMVEMCSRDLSLPQNSFFLAHDTADIASKSIKSFFECKDYVNAVYMGE